MGYLDVNAVQAASSAVFTPSTQIAAAVWNSSRTDYATAGTFGEVETSTDVAAAVWADPALHGADGGALDDGDVDWPAGHVHGVVVGLRGADGDPLHDGVGHIIGCWLDDDRERSPRCGVRLLTRQHEYLCEDHVIAEKVWQGESGDGSRVGGKAEGGDDCWQASMHAA